MYCFDGYPFTLQINVSNTTCSSRMVGLYSSNLVVVDSTLVIKSKSSLSLGRHFAGGFTRAT